MLTREERFWSKVWFMPTGCLLWTDSLNGDAGYGNFKWATGEPMSAHRAAWRLAGRPLPERPLLLDHRCRNRWCVNVDHLRVATYSANTNAEIHKNVETCRSGRHAWVEENIVIEKSGRKCRPCRDENHKQWLLSHR